MCKQGSANSLTRAMFVAAMTTMLLAAAAARACGPGFPDTILNDADDDLLRSPKADFWDEVKRLLPQVKPKFLIVRGDKESAYEQTADADLADLGEALKAGGKGEMEIKTIVAAHLPVRTELQRIGQAIDGWQEKGLDPRLYPAPRLGELAVPAGLPEEFAQYTRGAILYRQGKIEDARKVWQSMLETPKPYRATWAAYMLARSYVDSDPAEAVKRFPLVGELVGKGYKDSAGLAAASVGWQARAELNLRNYEKAFQLYIEQAAAGDVFALASLQRTSARAFTEGESALKKLAASPTARAVVAAYINALGGQFQKSPDPKLCRAWLAAVEAAGAKDVPDADRLAWAAYSSGDFQAAARWLGRIKKDTPVSHWVRAKLLMREGKLTDASDELAAAVKGLPSEPNIQDYYVAEDLGGITYNRKYAAGELACLKLSGMQYREAMDLLLKHNWWQDAAYIAERVLTMRELKAYVDGNYPDNNGALPKEDDADEPRWPVEIGPRLRHLLGRRLVREGHSEQACPYFPNKFRAALDEYSKALAVASDNKQNAGLRAKSYWTAAKLARYQGMELMGSELGPDAFIWSGEFTVDDEAEGIGRILATTQPDHGPMRIAPASKDEVARTRKTLIQPYKRFHYRYIAADLAWRAAALMDDNDEQTARILCQAGRWLSVRDPEAADRFYKALVNRCSQTALGQQAKQLRWLPTLTDKDQASLGIEKHD